MEIISTILVLGLAVAPIALIAGWLAGRGHRGLGALVGGPAGDGWWRTAMPLPHGVQEDDDFKWNFGDREPPILASEPDGQAPEAMERVEPARTRLRTRPRIR